MSDLKKLSKVYVVDDSDLSRKTICGILEDNGYNVVGSASNASDAIKNLATLNPNVFIIDIVMPEISGLDFAVKIKERYKKSSIIMMSSLSQDSIIMESISTGAKDFIQKPFEPADLVVSVAKVLSTMKEDGKI